MADIIIGSTWGFDQMLPRNFSVVTETRFYPIEENLKWLNPIDSLKMEPYIGSIED